MKGAGGKGDWGGGRKMQNHLSSCLCRILCYFRGWVGVGAGGGWGGGGGGKKIKYELQQHY